MTHRIGSKGQVVIPKGLRERRGFSAGTPVTFAEREDGVLVKVSTERRPLKGRFAGSGMAEQLLEDRAREPR